METGMDVRAAVEVLRRRLADCESDPQAAAAWQALDTHLSRAGALPPQWERMTSARAAAYVKAVSQNRWATACMKGIAPPHEGVDSAGRQTWSVATLDRYRNGEWSAGEAPPPTDATVDAWRRWAKARGLRPRRAATVEDIRALALRVGALPAESA